ncbi:hypothetical protein DTO032I4_6335 [Paecilomyces variotii]|nr:hypothetical protein DTO032I4_6335 [Paecilomyces variotii]
MDKHLHKVIVLFRTESDRHAYSPTISSFGIWSLEFLFYAISTNKGWNRCFDTSTLQIARRCDCWSASETSLRSESNRQLYSYIPSPLTPRRPIQLSNFLLLLYQKDVENHPAFLLLLTLAVHPNPTLDYDRMSVMSRMLPEDMWTSSHEIAANIRALEELADMIRRADSMPVDDLEHTELEQARLRSSTGAGYGQNGPNQVLQPHTTPGPAEALFDHDQETSLPGPAYRVDGIEYNGDDDDDDRTSVASWISGRVWIPSELGQNDNHTYGLSAGAGDSEEQRSSSQWPASNTERDERLLRSPSMPYSVAAEYDTRSEQFTDSFEIEREATHVNPDQNGRDSTFWPSLNMMLDERPLLSLSSSSSSSSSSVPCSDTVDSCSEQFMNPEEQSQWRTPSRAREYNHGDQPAVPPWVFTNAISGGYRLPPLFMPFTDTVHDSEEFDFDVISDAASVCSIGGGVWMGD